MENKKVFSSNLLIRIISALILIPIVLSVVYSGGFIFYIMLTIAVIIMAQEWKVFNRASGNKTVWQLIGGFYITIPCISMVYLINTLQGTSVVIWLLLTVWITDIAAFVFGKIIGGPKLVPTISPNKTWSGMIGALVTTFTFAFASIVYFEPFSKIGLIAATLLISALAIIGDLVESWIKRQFSIKDSGKIIPGHGGVLDRVDGLIFSTPAAAILVALYENYIF